MQSYCSWVNAEETQDWAIPSALEEMSKNSTNGIEFCFLTVWGPWETYWAGNVKVLEKNV